MIIKPWHRRLFTCGTVVAILTGAFAGTANAAPVQEDSPRWSCARNGNRICGPGNPNHAPAGLYNRDGQMIKAWVDYGHPWRDALSGLSKQEAQARYGHLSPLPADQVPAWVPEIVWTPQLIDEARRDLAAGH
jgi:hypothetical protein